MTAVGNTMIKWRWPTFLFVFGAVLTLSFLLGCGPSNSDLEAVQYAPLPEVDWQVSTPEKQGLDPSLLARLYHEAAELETLYGLLVIKNGYLIAEKYFNEGAIDQVSGRQSSTKSFTSALVGIALDQGCLQDVDQKMMNFFPEYAEEITDPRKEQITIRHLLQMRGGYPDEEYTSNLFELMFFQGNWKFLPHLVDFPLAGEPGVTYQYSNLTSHLLGAIVTRACGQDLESFAQEYLFSPMKADLYGWQVDDDGYNWGFGEIYVTARNMAKFGQMYLDGGAYDGKQILAADWVDASLQRFSENIIRGHIFPWYGSFRDRGYGYQWWSSRVGDHYFNYASGHGGNYIILLPELDMVIVTTADPLHDMWDGDPWKYEGAINRLVGRFIKSLPMKVEGRDSVLMSIIVRSVFVLAVIILCLTKPNAGRIFLGLSFLVMAIGVNGSFALTNPQTYVDNADQALIPFYRHVALTVVELNPILFGLLLMAFEIAMGLLLLHKGKSVRVGFIGTMVFLVGIAPLSVIQFPWLGLLVGQAHLLTREFDASLLDIIKSKFQAAAV